MPVGSRRARTATPRSKGKLRGPVGTTSDTIYQAAEDLFYEFGYEGTSLRDIADAVGLQVGSLYNHIASKEQLLVEIMRSSMNGLMTAVTDAVEGTDDPVQSLRAFMKATIVFHGQHARQAFIGNTELRSLPDAQHDEIQDLRDAYQQRLIDLLEQCKAAGVAVPDVQMAAFSCVAICSYVSSWYDPSGRLTLDEVAEHLASTFAPLAQTPSMASGKRQRTG